MINSKGQLVSALLLVAGFIGAFIESERREASGIPVPGVGEFWRIVGSTGQVKKFVGPTRGLAIRPGERFVVDDVISPSIELQSMELRVENSGNQSGFVRIDFKNDDNENYRLVIVPGPETQVSLSRRSSRGRQEKLIDASHAGVLPDAETAFDLRLQGDRGSLAVEINGQELLRYDEGFIPLRRALVRADDVRLLAAHVIGERKKKGRVRGRFEKSQDLTHFTGEARTTAERLLWISTWAVALVLILAGYLRHLCLGAPPGRLLWRTTIDCFAIPAAVIGLAPWIPDSATYVALLFAGSFALRLAMRRLKAHLHHGQPLGLRGGLRCVTWILLLGGATAWSSGWARNESLQEPIEAARKARRQLSEQSFVLETDLTLDHSNALTVPGPYRSSITKARLTLASGSLLELRQRTQAGGALGMALFVSSDERWESGFVHESRSAFAALGERFGSVAAGREIELEVRAHGDDYEAYVDGRLVARATLREFPSGSIIALAARGRVEVTQFSVSPTTPEPAPKGAAEETSAAASYPLCLLAVLGLLAWLLLRAPLLPSFEAAAWMLLPLLVGIQGWVEPDGRAGLEAMSLTWFAFVAFALPWPLLRARSAGALRTLTFLVSASAGGLAALNASVGPPITDRGDPGSAWNEYDLARLEEGLSHLQHPYVRRMNDYLRDHSFRGRSFPPRPAPGTIRILALGGSSTWGHGIQEASGQDYPTTLERLLNDGHPTPRFEVINGAVKGCSGPRLLRILRESLIEFRPAIVTLSLYYNDSHYLNQVDEEEYLARISAPDYEHGLFERARELIYKRRQERIVGHLWSTQNEWEGNTLGAWNERVRDPEITSPPERFEASLRGFAELGRQEGFELVLIQEPIRGNPQRIWRDEFRAAMERVGADYGLTVVSPEEELAAAGGAKLFMDDVHPLPAGHRVMAEALVPVIEEIVERDDLDR